MTKTKEHQRKAGYGRSKQIHDRKRTDTRYLTSSELSLREAVRRTGYVLVGWEYEREGMLWFDVACWIAERLVLIDLAPGWSSGKRRSTIKKVAYTNKRNIPLLILPATSTVLNYQARIEKFVLTDVKLTSALRQDK